MTTSDHYAYVFDFSMQQTFLLLSACITDCLVCDLDLACLECEEGLSLSYDKTECLRKKGIINSICNETTFKFFTKGLYVGWMDLDLDYKLYFVNINVNIHLLNKMQNAQYK